MSLTTGQVTNEQSGLRTKAGANIGGANEHNRRVVMQGLRVNGAMTRAQIARGTGLVPQTVSNIVEDLEREGLVVAAQRVKGGRGQPATPYSIAPNGAFAIGLQIDQDHLCAVVVNLLGEVVVGTQTVLQPGGLKANLPLILAALHGVAAAPVLLAVSASPKILGVGVAMPAPTGVHAVPDDPWMVGLTEAHPIVEVLQRETGLSVSLHHDASAAAVAERITGVAMGLDSFVLIFVSYGIGAGIYIGGELARGHRRLAGELGLVLVPDGDQMVPLEDRASLKRLFASLGLVPNQPDLFAQLEAAVGNSAPEVDEWVSDAASVMAWAIGTIQCLLDPEAVVIGGQMPESLMALLFEAILNAQAKAQAGGEATYARPVRGSVAPFSVAAGAAADPIARAFDPSLSALMKPSN
jgi:predicted NBD/HSP70 family sugar kinase